MSDKKELNQEQLEKVSGGKDMAKYLPSDHGIHIGMYAAEGHIGEDVYVVDDSNREIFCWGTLLDSYEEDVWGGSQRRHKVYVKGTNDYFFNHWDVGDTINPRGDGVTLFLYR